MASKMNAYETDIDKIPATDLFLEQFLYGRYRATDTDFRPDPNKSGSDTEYWDGVLSLLSSDHKNSDTPGFEDNRDIYFFGTLVIHSGHAQEHKPEHKRYRLRDMNDVAGMKWMEKNVPSIRVPKVYFQGELRGGDVLIVERIEGVTLNIAWQYLTWAEKTSFKKQVHALILELASHTDADYPSPSFIFRDCNAPEYMSFTRGHEILFEPCAEEDLPGFVHGDLAMSNIVVNDGKIVALIDFEYAGFFGMKRMAKLVKHRLDASYGHLNFSKEKWLELFYLSDIYEETIEFWPGEDENTQGQ